MDEDTMKEMFDNYENASRQKWENEKFAHLEARIEALEKIIKDQGLPLG